MDLRLETTRLVLRSLVLRDAPVVFAAIDADREWLSDWLRWPVRMMTLEQVERWIAETAPLSTAFRIGAFSRQSGDLVGCFGAQHKFHPDELDLSYWLRRRETGVGYAREGVAALACLGRTLPGVRAVTIHCEPRNEASRRVALASGFIAAGPVPGADRPMERFELNIVGVVPSPPP